LVTDVSQKLLGLIFKSQAVKEKLIYSSNKKTRIIFHHRESLKSRKTHRKPGYTLPTLVSIHNSINVRFTPCIITVNHFYYPTNALDYIKLEVKIYFV